MTLNNQKKYLCPNEKGCTFPRELFPTAQEKLYEMVSGRFVKGDICSFRIRNDGDSLIYLRVEYLLNTEMNLIKGTEINAVTAEYRELKAGQTFTTDLDFFVILEA